MVVWQALAFKHPENKGGPGNSDTPRWANDGTILHPVPDDQGAKVVQIIRVLWNKHMEQRKGDHGHKAQVLRSLASSGRRQEGRSDRKATWPAPPSHLRWFCPPHPQVDRPPSPTGLNFPRVAVGNKK